MAVGTTGSATTTVTPTVTVDAGSNRVFIAAAIQSRTPPNMLNNATLNGVAASGTAVFATGVTGSTNYRVAIWYWLESALATVGTGSKTLSFTGSTTGMVVGWLNATDIAQQAPESTTTVDAASMTNGELSIAPSPVSSGALLVSAWRTNSSVSAIDGTAVIATGVNYGMQYRTDGSSLFADHVGPGPVLAGAASFAPAPVSISPLVMTWVR